MERYIFRFQDRVFFERFKELSDKQIKVYLGLRLAWSLGKNPDVQRYAQEEIEAGRGGIPIEEAGWVMDVELLCEKGFILRERTG